MSDPKRLLDEGADELGLSLLRAGRALDTEKARQRKLAVLGAGAALTAAASANATRGLFQGLFTKWIALGLVGTVIAAGIAARVLSSPEHALTPSVRAVLAEHPVYTGEAAPSPLADTQAPAPAAEAPTAAPGLSIDSLPSTAEVPTPAARPGESGAKPSSLAANRPAAPSADSPTSTLANEVSALREAREALAAGQSRRALAALDAYVQRFPGGHLGLEAEELRIEALAASGNSAAAAARARSFLAAHPTSPYAHRLRALAFPSGDEGQPKK